MAGSIGEYMVQSKPSGNRRGKLVTWDDPTADVVDGGQREYVVTTTATSTTTTTTTQIAEIQSIPADFSSFLVGRHVVKDGNLYLMNRVDPLFFYLAAQEAHVGSSSSSNSKNNEKGDIPPTKQPWQPFDQIRLTRVSRADERHDAPYSSLPSSSSSSSSSQEQQLRQAISEEQLKHLCTTFCNDDVTYFRFDPPKALRWLQRKQERVLQSLMQQTKERKLISAERYNNNPVHNDSSRGLTKTVNSNHSGAVSDTFYMPEEDPMSTPPSPDGGADNDSSAISPSESEQLKLESVQILCSYLNEEWTKEFAHHLGLTMTQVTTGNLASSSSSKENKKDHDSANRTAKSSTTPVVNVGRSNSNSNTAQTRLTSAYRTIGNKRLEQVKTKGMKPISSFFGAPKAKKAKHHQ